jgi:hypothetical protein
MPKISRKNFNIAKLFQNASQLIKMVSTNFRAGGLPRLFIFLFFLNLGPPESRANFKRNTREFYSKSRVLDIIQMIRIMLKSREF